ncbi:MAG: hypothetical protein QMD21_07430 [Candidatus Thermoplasmatota archaeon]|nr:hypothetical protein [Candidatus Thermoplasmatota archaeon]
MKVIADTSALISIELSGLLSICLENFQFILGPKVRSELEEIAIIDDPIGRAARKILKLIEKQIELRESKKEFEYGEYEALELLKELDASLLISDDIEFVSKEEEKDDRISFSTILIFILYKIGKISKAKAISAVDKIFEHREWKENLIYIIAKHLLEEE